MTSLVIVVCAASGYGLVRKLMLAAHDAGMTSDEYVWVLPSITSRGYGTFNCKYLELVQFFHFRRDRLFEWTSDENLGDLSKRWSRRNRAFCIYAFVGNWIWCAYSSLRRFSSDSFRTICVVVHYGCCVFAHEIVLHQYLQRRSLRWISIITQNDIL